MIRHLAPLVLCLLLCGCSSDRVTRANFDRLKPGMSRADVQAILGPPQHQYQGGILSWSGGHEQRVITVILDDRGLVSELNQSGL